MRLIKSDIKMLKITKKTEYALIALSHIEKSKDDIFTTSKDIALHYNIPKELMAKILQLMAKIGYIKSIKGPYGGYKSNIELDNISLKEFIESIEGPLALTDCYVNDDCSQIKSCNIKKPIQRINDNFINFLDKISLIEITK